MICLEILLVKKFIGDSWSELELLLFNDFFYFVVYLCLLFLGDCFFFSLDMLGGFGGKDIYFFFWDGDVWGNSINLGSGINIEGDEIILFFDENGNLYFVLDGYFGFGG